MQAQVHAPQDPEDQLEMDEIRVVNEGVGAAAVGPAAGDAADAYNPPAGGDVAGANNPPAGGDAADAHNPPAGGDAAGEHNLPAGGNGGATPRRSGRKTQKTVRFSPSAYFSKRGKSKGD